jgi:hypothetical protein
MRIWLNLYRMPDGDIDAYAYDRKVVPLDHVGQRIVEGFPIEVPDPPKVVWVDGEKWTRHEDGSWWTDRGDHAYAYGTAASLMERVWELENPDIDRSSAP